MFPTRESEEEVGVDINPHQPTHRPSSISLSFLLSLVRFAKLLPSIRRKETARPVCHSKKEEGILQRCLKRPSFFSVTLVLEIEVVPLLFSMVHILTNSRMLDECLYAGFTPNLTSRQNQSTETRLALTYKKRRKNNNASIIWKFK